MLAYENLSQTTNFESIDVFKNNFFYSNEKKLSDEKTN